MGDSSPLPNNTAKARSSRNTFKHLFPAECERTTSNSASEKDSNSKSIKRKPHRKSRYGCQSCKTRRIKCDEGKPQCSSCKKHRIKCDYPGSFEPGHGGPIGNRSRSNALNISDIELTYHWTTSTCQSLSVWSSGAAFWQSDITQLGFVHHYILHLIFAFTALHLAYSRPEQRGEYVALADHHYDIALTAVTSELGNIHPENCHAVSMGVQLICCICWARGPQPGEYLAFGQTGRSEWLIMFRGIRTTREIMSAEYLRVKVPERPLRLDSEPPQFERAISELRDWVQYVSSTEVECYENLQNVDLLMECFRGRYGARESELLLVFAWLYKSSEQFLLRLQNYDPIPLIVYAYFTVLLGDMERLWYIKGWTAHVLSGIYEVLPVEYRVMIMWPMAQVGWIPPKQEDYIFRRIHTHP